MVDEGYTGSEPGPEPGPWPGGHPGPEPGMTYEPQTWIDEGADATQRTCSGQCGDQTVGPILCPPGKSPAVKCPSRPGEQPQIVCLAPGELPPWLY